MSKKYSKMFLNEFLKIDTKYSKKIRNITHIGHNHGQQRIITSLGKENF